MSLRWKRVNHWKNIRALVGGDHGKAFAYIQRGRRPNEYTIVFPENAYMWTVRHHNRIKGEVANPVADYVLTESSLASAKAVGILIVKSLGLDL